MPPVETTAILIGGASGTGKSTVASEVARRLRIVHMIPSDMMRRGLRAVLSPELDAAIHHESFDVPAPPGAPTTEGVYVAGFEAQAATVCRALDAVVEHARLERWLCLLEGVHFIPRQHPPDVRAVLLACLDEEKHREHFVTRGEGSAGGRPADHYLRNFDRIRVIQRFLVERANEHGTPVLDTSRATESATVERVLEIVAGD